MVVYKAAAVSREPAAQLVPDTVPDFGRRPVDAIGSVTGIDGQFEQRCDGVRQGRDSLSVGGMVGVKELRPRNFITEVRPDFSQKVVDAGERYRPRKLDSKRASLPG